MLVLLELSDFDCDNASDQVTVSVSFGRRVPEDAVKVRLRLILRLSLSLSLFVAVDDKRVVFVDVDVVIALADFTDVVVALADVADINCPQITQRHCTCLLDSVISSPYDAQPRSNHTGWRLESFQEKEEKKRPGRRTLDNGLKPTQSSKIGPVEHVLFEFPLFGSL